MAKKFFLIVLGILFEQTEPCQPKAAIAGHCNEPFMKLQHTQYPFYISALTRLFLLALVILFLILGKELLIPLTIAVFLTFILLPISTWLEKHHFPRSIAVLTSIILFFVVIAAFIWFLYAQAHSFSDDGGELKTKIAKKINSLQIYIREHFRVTKRDQSKWMDKKISTIMEEGDQYLMTFFSITGSFLTNLALIPLYVYFLTTYRTKIIKFISLKSNGDHESKLIILHSISRVAQKYLKGLTIDILIVTALCSISFLIIGVKHAILFGILVAICNVIIPYMGLTFASILPFFMTIITHDEIGYALSVVGVCILIQFIDNHFINPYIVGSSVSINPLTAFIALAASAMIWGIFGMLLCIPVTGMIKVICDNVESLKPYGYIIGQEKIFGMNEKEELIRKRKAAMRFIRRRNKSTA